jgi:hypothetical protein
MKTIQLLSKKADCPANVGQIKTLRSYKNFKCNTPDSVLMKNLGTKQASEIIDRLKNEEEIELKG